MTPTDASRDTPIRRRQYHAKYHGVRAWWAASDARRHLRVSLRAAWPTAALLAAAVLLLVGMRMGEWLHAWGAV